MGNEKHISSPYYDDLKRVAELASENLELYLYLDDIIQKEDTGSFMASPAIFECAGISCGPHVFGLLSPRRAVESVYNLFRKALAKKDTESKNKLFEEFSQCHKDNLINGLLESLSKQSPERQKEVIAHVLGLSDAKCRVAIDIIERDYDTKQNRDQYKYYVSFRNLQNKERRIVTFQSHASAAIYVMHLMDRKIRKEDCMPIDVLKNVRLLESIYVKLFKNDTTLKGIKKELTSDADGNYVKSKQRLHQYYQDINNTVNMKVRDWDYVLPYRCEMGATIGLDPNLISIPQELFPEKWEIVD